MTEIIFTANFPKVWVKVGDNGSAKRLKRRRDIRDFTSGNLAWGRPPQSDDPRQLQLAVDILACVLGDDHAACYQAFADEVLSKLDPRDFRLTETEVRAWWTGSLEEVCDEGAGRSPQEVVPETSDAVQGQGGEGEPDGSEPPEDPSPPLSSS